MEVTKEKQKRNAFLRLFTITIFILIASIDNSAMDMAPSIYWAMKTQIMADEIFLGFVNSVLIWVVATSAVFWGYLGDKGNRKNLLLYGTAIWVASLFFTPFVFNKWSWMIIQIVAGIGLGCIASVGFSVIVDFVSPERRGLALSFWGMSQGIGTFFGKGLASILVTDEELWWLPFVICSIIGFVLIVLYFFTLDPKRGAMEEELKDVNYEYNIKNEDLKFILKKPTNLALMFQGLTAQVVWGSLTWLPYVFTQRIISQGFIPSSAGLVGNLIAGLFQLGGIFSILFGALGDKYQKTSLKARPLISTIGVFSGIILFILMLLIPFDLSEIATTQGTMNLILALLGQIFKNPLFLLMFICSIGAAAAMSADSPNFFAIIGDVNLPEHRGTIFGLANLINGIGRGIGSVVFPAVSAAYLTNYPDPMNYFWSLIIIQLFFIPTGICYLIACFTIEKDMKTVKRIMSERAKEIRNRNQT